MAPQQLSVATACFMAWLIERGRQAVTSSSNERGSAMSEYGILIALVFIVGIAAVAFFGDAVAALFTEVNEEYEAIGPTAPSNANTN